MKLGLVCVYVYVCVCAHQFWRLVFPNWHPLPTTTPAIRSRQIDRESRRPRTLPRPTQVQDAGGGGHPPKMQLNCHFSPCLPRSSGSRRLVTRIKKVSSEKRFFVINCCRDLGFRFMAHIKLLWFLKRPHRYTHC